MKNLRQTIIGSIQFSIEAQNVFERVFWIAFTFVGTIFVCHLLDIQASSWNSFIISQKYMDLSKIDFPAVTFCSRGATKYSIVERLGNLLDPNADEIKKQILPLRNSLIQHIVGYPHDMSCSKQCVSEFGNLCKFPFKLDGKVHDKCYEEKTNKFICPTEVDEYGISGQKYEECTYNCNLPCVTKDYKTCIFPFKYKGRSYNKCTRDWVFGIGMYSNQPSWCATKVNQSTQEMIKWEICKNQSILVSTEQLCSVS